MNSEIPKARVVKGLPAPIVIIGAIVVLGAFGGALYALLHGLDDSRSPVQWTGKQVEKPLEPAANSKWAETPIPVIASAAPLQKAQPAQETVAAAPDTYDIGAYLTYGGAAFLLTRAVARLSPDRLRLAVGLFEDAQKAGAPPALAIMFEFHKPLAKCSKKNIKELTLIFNLKSMGDIKAQQAQEIRRSSQEIDQALSDFRCELKPGGRLDLQILGASQTLLQPAGSTFGWGARLAQKIG